MIERYNDTILGYNNVMTERYSDRKIQWYSDTRIQ